MIRWVFGTRHKFWQPDTYEDETGEGKHCHEFVKVSSSSTVFWLVFVISKHECLHNFLRCVSCKVKNLRSWGKIGTEAFTKRPCHKVALSESICQAKSIACTQRARKSEHLWRLNPPVRIGVIEFNAGSVFKQHDSCLKRECRPKWYLKVRALFWGPMPK